MSSPESNLGSKMNKKSRIKHTIAFKKTDLIPWQITYTKDIAEALLDLLGLEYCNLKVLDNYIMPYKNLDDYFGNHLALMHSRPINSYKEVKPGYWQDEWGVIWDRRIDKDIGNPSNCLLAEPKLGDLILPDPDSPDRYAHFNPVIENTPGRYHIVKFSYNLFERAWSMRGMENLLMDFVINPNFVNRLFQKITDFNIKILKNLKDFKIDGILFSDDWGYQSGLIISPKDWRKFIKPHVKEMFSVCASMGYDVFIHSCGDISSILDDLVETGLDVFNPLQPEVVDVKETILKYKGVMGFYGSVGVQSTLAKGGEEQVKKEIKNRIQIGKETSGLIIGPSHDLPKDVPLKNVLAMAQILKNQ